MLNAFQDKAKKSFFFVCFSFTKKKKKERKKEKNISKGQISELTFSIWVFQTSTFSVHEIDWLDFLKEKNEKSKEKEKEKKNKTKGELKERKEKSLFIPPYLKRSIMCNPSKVLMMLKFWNKNFLDCELKNS